MDNKKNELLNLTYSQLFNEEELEIISRWFRKKYEDYTEYYKSYPVKTKELNDVNKYLLNLRNKEIDEIPKRIKKDERLRLIRKIERETRPYTELEVSTFSYCNEYLRWIEAIKSDDKIVLVSIFEYQCYVENTFSERNLKEKEISAKCKNHRTICYKIIEEKLTKKKSKKIEEKSTKKKSKKDIEKGEEV